MAVGARPKPDLEERSFTRRCVALRTRKRCVFARQGVSRGGMINNLELRRPPTIHGVARRALAAVSPLCKLSRVRIGSMAIRTLRKRNRTLEVACNVALRTSHGRVLAEQRKLGCAVIEPRVQHLDRD